MTLEVLVNSIQSATVIWCFWRIMKKADRRAPSMVVIFFLFSCISLFINNIYWVVYDLMAADIRMPFAANEFGEMAIFLLFTSALTSAIPDTGESCVKEYAATILFTIASVALWIGWSGEWIQDILGGLWYGYFLCMTVRTVKQTGVLSDTEKRVFAIASACLLIGEGTIFFVPEAIGKPLDLFCYVLMYTCGLYLIFRSVTGLSQKRRAEQCMSLVAAALAWNTSCLYMSADGWYLFGLLADTVILVLFTRSVERTVDKS